jgi:hypothetical protein
MGWRKLLKVKTMSPDRVNCWICGQGNINRTRQNDLERLDCPRCGPYGISGSLYASAVPMPAGERHRLSFWCRQRQLDGRSPPELATESISAIIAGLPNPPASERTDILLLSLSKVYSKPGEEIPFDSGTNYSLACAHDAAEANFHFSALQQNGCLQLFRPSNVTPRISSKGWERIEQLRAAPIISKTAFVAMKFNPEMLALWSSAFAPAIRRAGFDPQLASDPPHNQPIDARTIAGLKGSRFVVADVTWANPGVYFEAGYALGHGRPIIWTRRQDRMTEDMHFDTRQFSHILWKDAAHLEGELYYRIVATI